MKKKDVSTCTNITRELEMTESFRSKEITRKLRALGLHRNQFKILRVISAGDSDIVQKHICEELKLTPAAVTNTLRSLIDEGIVQKERRNSDGRVRAVSLTRRGKLLLTRTDKYFEEYNEEMCRGISEEDLETVCRCLTTMRTNLEKLHKDDLLTGGYTDPGEDDEETDD